MPTKKTKQYNLKHKKKNDNTNTTKRKLNQF